MNTSYWVISGRLASKCFLWLFNVQISFNSNYITSFHPKIKIRKQENQQKLVNPNTNESSKSGRECFHANIRIIIDKLLSTNMTVTSLVALRTGEIIKKWPQCFWKRRSYKMVYYTLYFDEI